MTTIPLPQHSTLSWAGLTSQKFHGSIKTDYPHNNELINFTGKELPPHGRMHFQPKFGKDFPENVGIRTFAFHNQKGKMEEEKLARKVILHERQERVRKEMRHCKIKQSGCREDIPSGIKTYAHANSKSSTHYCNFELFGAHRLIQDFSQQRNNIPCKSLGDKAYRTPDYATGFFSKAQIKLEKEFVPMKIQEEKKWEFKVKQEARQQDLDAVDELELWEERMEIQKKEPEDEKQQPIKGKLPPKKK